MASAVSTPAPADKARYPAIFLALHNCRDILGEPVQLFPSPRAVARMLGADPRVEHCSRATLGAIGKHRREWFKERRGKAIAASRGRSAGHCQRCSRAGKDETRLHFAGPFANIQRRGRIARPTERHHAASPLRHRT